MRGEEVCGCAAASGGGREGEGGREGGREGRGGGDGQDEEEAGVWMCCRRREGSLRYILVGNLKTPLGLSFQRFVPRLPQISKLKRSKLSR